MVGEWGEGLGAWAAFEGEPDIVPALGRYLDFVGVPVPSDQSQLFEDAGVRVTLVPACQRLDAALGEQSAKVGMAEIGTVENGVHLLIRHKVGDSPHVVVAPVALVGHGNLHCRRYPPSLGGSYLMFQEVRVWPGIPSASVTPMKSMPTNTEVSARIGISEKEVALYRQSSSRRVDGF